MALPSLPAQRISSIEWAGPRLLLRLHRAGFGYSVVTWPSFAERVERARPDAVTVDVFETCVVRDLAGDRSIEEVAHRVSDADVGYTKAAADLELDLCRPVPGAVESLDRVRAVTGGIVFVSDTDRSSALLTDLLRRHDLFRDGDRLIASCELGITKSRGGLYDLVWPTDRPATIWHLGNNDWADGVMAAAHGYEPFDIPAGNLTRYEAALCRNPNSLGPVLAGAARSARLQLEHHHHTGRLDARTVQLNRMGAQVGGPMLAAFALWMGDQVREHGIDHLGFLARDGELIQRIADRVPDPAIQATDRSYVELNRRVVTLAMAATMGVPAWIEEGVNGSDDFLQVRMHAVSFAGLLERIGFQADDVATVMGRSFALTDVDPTEPLGPEHHHEWLALLEAPAAQELILDRATERRGLIIDYLDQLGLLAADQPAFVDVGWRGRTARLIKIAVGDQFATEPIHLHVGGDKVPADLDDHVRIHRFAFPGTTPTKPFDNPAFPVETITASGSPRVVDYERTVDGVVTPVRQPDPIDIGRDDRAELWRGALAMADRLPDWSRIASWQLDHHSLDAEVREILRLWWYEPDRAEAAALTTFGFEGDDAGVEIQPVLAPYALSDIVGGNRVARQWRQGSGVISPPASRLGLRVAMLGRRLLARARS